MQSVASPHMGINDPRAPVFVQMWNTWQIQPNEPIEHIMGWTASVARNAPGGKLGSLVLCCHGSPAYLQLGEGLGDSRVGAFATLRGLVDRIYVRACLVGRIVGPATASEGDADCVVNQMHATGNGHEFLRKIAINAQAEVVGSTELQATAYTTTNRLPYGKLDDWEGLWLRYGADGNIREQGRNPSVWNAVCTGSTPTATWYPRE